jgi:vacuolar protein sorting-associated protein 13D
MDFLRLFKYENIITIKHLIVKLFDVNLQVEEKLLWKIIQMLGFDKIDHSTFDPNISTNKNMSKTSSSSLSFKPNKSFSENDLIDSDPISLNYYKSRINSLIATSKAMKFSFNKLQIDRIGMTLSVYKTAKLSPELLKIKSSLGINLIQFENARIDLKAFILMNEHDTASCMLNLIKKHYAQALRENAIRILGSVDFLGNPLGFVVDFKESLTNVLSNGQVTDFVFSVTNSVANSVSKFSGFLSDELNEFTLDERHRETRDQIRNVYNNGSIDHFVGGALGFAVGIVGGALSLATQTYRGFYENGVSGAFAGLGKGAVGTVSKPIVGMLDFTNGIASAIRETSKTNYKMEVSRVRESRCCATPGALLTPFSRSDSEGQKILYQVNSFNLIEKYISMEQLNENQSETIIVSYFLLCNVFYLIF